MCNSIHELRYKGCLRCAPPQSYTVCSRTRARISLPPQSYHKTMIRSIIFSLLRVGLDRVLIGDCVLYSIICNQSWECTARYIPIYSCHTNRAHVFLLQIHCASSTIDEMALPKGKLKGPSFQLIIFPPPPSNLSTTTDLITLSSFQDFPQSENMLTIEVIRSDIRL